MPAGPTYDREPAPLSESERGAEIDRAIEETQRGIENADRFIRQLDEGDGDSIEHAGALRDRLHEILRDLKLRRDRTGK